MPRPEIRVVAFLSELGLDDRLEERRWAKVILAFADNVRRGDTTRLIDSFMR
jgi:hypothetical protein